MVAGRRTEGGGNVALTFDEEMRVASALARSIDLAAPAKALPRGADGVTIQYLNRTDPDGPAHHYDVLVRGKRPRDAMEATARHEFAHILDLMTSLSRGDLADLEPELSAI